MPFQRRWIYSTNPMLSVTASWYRLAIRISSFHLTRLLTRAGDPVYDPMIESYTPVNTTLVNAYTAWKQQGDSQLGQTLDFNNMLMLLSSTKIGKWDIALQNIYDNKTSQYKTLLPHKRTPFQSGKQEEVLSAVKVLSEAAEKDPKLATISAEITQFYGDLQKAFDAQKQSIGNTSFTSSAVEKARVAMCVAQFADLGGVIQANPADPDAICYFFDQLALREGTQVIYTGGSKPQQVKNILVHTFAAGDQLKLEGDESLTEQWFYLASQKDGKPGDKIIKIAASEIKTIDVEELGDLANRYLMVYNPNADMKGEWTVEFV